MAQVGRPPTCACGVCSKCKQRVAARERYQSLSKEERRALVEARDPERVRANDRARNTSPERIEHLTKNTAQWRRKHPDRVRAHTAVAYAIRTGRLVRQPCEVCGATDRVHAHHDDYAKPLDVRWLCPLHHAAER